MADPRIRDAINAQQTRLLADLEEARSKFKQGTDRGTAGFEVPFRRFLSGHLPRRFAVGQGEIIDSEGRESGQTDVVILDDDHPFHVEPDQPSLAFIEFVAAAGELKTTLTGENLQTTLEKSAQFKALRAAETEGTLIASNPGDTTRFVDHRPYFLVAAGSELRLETVAERVRAFDLATDGQIVDAVYLLDRGWVVNFGDGQGAFQFVTSVGSMAAWVQREVPAGEVLFDFFVWLSTVMPRFVRLGSPIGKYL
jgi:hypothetical protein